MIDTAEASVRLALVLAQARKDPLTDEAVHYCVEWPHRETLEGLPRQARLGADEGEFAELLRLLEGRRMRKLIRSFEELTEQALTEIEDAARDLSARGKGHKERKREPTGYC